MVPLRCAHRASIRDDVPAPTWLSRPFDVWFCLVFPSEERSLVLKHSQPYDIPWRLARHWLVVGLTVRRAVSAYRVLLYFEFHRIFSKVFIFQLQLFACHSTPI